MERGRDIDGVKTSECESGTKKGPLAELELELGLGSSDWFFFSFSWVMRMGFIVLVEGFWLAGWHPLGYFSLSVNYLICPSFIY